MTRYLALLAFLAALLVAAVAFSARAVTAPGPAGWETASRGLAPEPPNHALLGPISAGGRKAWDCWPQLEAESPTLDPVFPQSPEERTQPRSEDRPGP